MANQQTLITDLREAIRDRKAVIVVGTGASIAATDGASNASWQGLLRSGIEHCVEVRQDLSSEWASIRIRQIDLGELVPAAEQIESALKTAHEYQRWLADTVGKLHRGSLTRSVAEAIGSLAVPIATTNYDTILETVLDRRSLTWRDINRAQGWLRGDDDANDKGIFHIHGVWDEPDSVVLGIRGYERIVRDPAAQQILRSLWATRTLVFVGFGAGLVDPNFGEFLEWARNTFPDSPYRHYRLVKDSERVETQRTHAKDRIIALSYGVGYSELSTFLSELSAGARPVVPGVDQRLRGIFAIPFSEKSTRVVGRERAMKAIEDSLTVDVYPSGAMAALVGIGGVGKTQMAVEYCHQFRERYHEGVFWFDCGRDIDTQLIRYSERAGWIHSEATAADKLAAANRGISLLENALIVLDDVSDVEMIRERFFRPAPPTLHTILTSKQPIPQVRAIRSDDLALSIPQAVQLLRLESRRNFADDDLAAIGLVELFDSLPLAIEIAAVYLRERPSIGLKEYTEAIRQRGFNAPGMSPQEITSFTNHAPNLRQAVEISDDVAAEEPLVADVLACFGLTPSTSIGRSFLAAMLGIREEDLRLSGALDRADQMRILRHETQSDTNEERWRMHRLVWDVYHLRAAAQFSEEAILTIAKRVTEWFRERHLKFERLREFEAEADKVRFWRERLLQRDEYALAAELMWLEAYLPFHRGHWQESLNLVDRALALYEPLFDRRPSVLSRMLGDRAVLTTWLGRPTEALDYAARAVAVVPVGCEFDDERMHALLAMAHVQRDFSAFVNAIEAAEQVVRLASTIDQQVPALIMIVDCLCELDRPDEAFGRLMELRDSAANLNVKTRMELLTVCGDVEADLDHPASALDYYQRAYDIARDNLGSKHPSTVGLIARIGDAYLRSKEYDIARGYLEQARNIRVEILGPNHPSTGFSFLNIGSTYQRLGRLDDAIEYKSTGFDIIEAAFGKAHLKTAVAASTLANALFHGNRTEEALALLERALVVFRATLGEQHGNTAVASVGLAECYWRLGDYQRAFALVSKVANSIPPKGRHRDRVDDLMVKMRKSGKLRGFRVTGKGKKR